MKKAIKFLSLALSLVLALVLFVSCGGKAEKLLDSYLLEADGTVVSKDFTLEKNLTKNGNKYGLTWSSNKENIVISAQEDNYLAKVVRPESGEVVVTLTVKVNEETKDFTVRVKALEAYDFGNAFVFAQYRKEVYKDFEVATETEIDGKKATIAWEVLQGSEKYLSIVGNTVKIEPQATAVKAFLKATFTYGGKTSSQTYYVFPTLEKGHDEEINAIYSKTGYGAADFTGYVTVVGAAYDSGFKNATFYVQDEQSTAGYYFYRSKNEDTENGAKLEAGVKVTVTGFTTRNYDGLWETDNGGTFTVDTKAEKKDMSQDVYAADNDIIGNVATARFQESRYVSLTNWQVKEVKKTALDTGSSTNELLILQKQGAEVAVEVSKYFAGSYAWNKDDAALSAIFTKSSSFKAGDWVSVKGILSNNVGSHKATELGWAIMLQKADHLVAGAEDTAAAGSSAGAKVGALQAVHMTALTNAGAYADGAAKIVTSTKEFTLATKNTAEDVTVTFKVPFSRAVEVSEAGAVKITPTETEEEATIIATYTCGEYVTKAYYTIKSRSAGNLTVTFDSKGGSAVDTQSVPYGDKATRPATDPTKDGFEFVSWVVSEAEDAAAYDFNKEVKENITLYAKWKELGAKGTATNPYTAAEALAEIKKLELGKDSTTKVYVLATVGSAPTADYCNFNLVVGDEVIIVYGLAKDAEFTQRYGSKREIKELPIKQGDEVLLCAFLSNFKNNNASKPELTKAQLLEVNGQALPTDDPATGAKGTATNPYTAAEALAEIKKLELGKDSTTKVYVLATVGSAPTADYCNFNLVVGDEVIIVYGLAKDAEFTQRYGSKREIKELPIKQGDEVLLCAFLSNFKNNNASKPELTKAQLLEVNGAALEA